jgi:membrane protein implicated in regulation of membrane protease activity
MAKMSKDKIIGLLILVGALALLVFYSLWLIGGWIQANIVSTGPFGWMLFFPAIPGLPWELAVILPLWLVAILVLAIAMWIGFSMLTTPPPVPLEELEEELEAEEAEEKKKEAEKKP